jgi:ABC-type multidrug transport system ATPase subunit
MTAYALEIANLRKSFGNSEIIRGINLQVKKGERIAIIGPNGEGKSSLFNLISVIVISIFIWIRFDSFYNFHVRMFYILTVGNVDFDPFL